MMLEIVYSAAAILSIVGAVLLFKVVRILGTGKLRRGYILLAGGILLGVTINSLAELAGIYGFLGNDIIQVTRPVLIAIGSAMFIIAGISILKALEGK